MEHQLYETNLKMDFFYKKNSKNSKNEKITHFLPNKIILTSGRSMMTGVFM